MLSCYAYHWLIQGLIAGSNVQRFTRGLSYLVHNYRRGVMAEKTITVALQDETSVEYVMRGLNDDEIGTWAEFCASVFSYKANPPPASYFERHYYNDPNRQASFVRVMVTADTSEIVSSCRVFVREISLGSDENGEIKTAQAGGIGEVCTSEAHRKRGLSKLLLHNAIEIMKDRNNMQVSLLHASPEFFPVYQKGGGYSNTVSKWSVLSIQIDKLPTSDNIRLAEFPRDTKRLQSLHQEYSESSFVGCIVRSEKYWNEYLSKELDGSLYVIEKDDIIIAWMSLRNRGSRLQLREFGCDVGNFSVETFGQLLEKCLEDSFQDTAEGSGEGFTMDLHLPSFVAEPIMSSEFVKGAPTAEDDMGWMYLTLQDGGVDVVNLNQTRPHLIWPSDSF